MESTAVAVAEPATTGRHVPHDLVREILIRLLVRSLLRFMSVCKAWCSTISDDPSFGRAQLHHNRHKEDPWLLIAPQMEVDTRHDTGIGPTAGLYRWRESCRDAVLVYPMESLESELAHPFAHCDGLVLVGTRSEVRVLNLATESVLKLPESLSCASSCCESWNCCHRYSSEAFGLGHDPRTDAYKVARFFIKAKPDPLGIMDTRYLPCVEVLTIGVDQHWREMTERPSRRSMGRRTATFFRGSLLWTIEKYDPEDVSAYLRFKLEEETFSIIPSPPYRCLLDGHKASNMSKLRGELCVASPHNHRAIDIWMCNDLDAIGANLPRWDKRYTIRRDRPQSSLHPVVVLGDGVLVCKSSLRNRLCCCDLQTKKRVKVKDSFGLSDISYRNLREGKRFKYLRCRHGSHFDVIPYVPSLVPI